VRVSWLFVCGFHLLYKKVTPDCIACSMHVSVSHLRNICASRPAPYFLGFPRVRHSDSPEKVYRCGDATANTRHTLQHCPNLQQRGCLQAQTARRGRPALACQRPCLSTTSTSTPQAFAKGKACSYPDMKITLVMASACTALSAMTLTEDSAWGE